MPAAEKDLDTSTSLEDLPPQLPFPPVTTSHIINCSYHSWYPNYRSRIPKARLVPLPHSFISYLCADGIVLPQEEMQTFSDDKDPAEEDDKYDNSEDDTPDPSEAWPEIHAKIKETIAELGGSVMPKLNWSAPKDATWISATNSMECRTANDVYLLLKSSDFVTHDLEQAFDGCVDQEQAEREEARTPPGHVAQHSKVTEKIAYHLVLRKTIPAFNPSMEFRCFVRNRALLCICQRDLNHYNFLAALLPKLRHLIQEFFEKHMKDTFPDPNFVFDVYTPSPHDRVWLIDINPWAPRTDPLLFSWMEILEMSVPEVDEESDESDSESQQAVENERHSPNSGSESSADEELLMPEFRLVNRDDPEALNFSTPQYSAHKLPKDVVDAGVEGEAGMREFIGRWREIVREQEEEREKEKEAEKESLESDTSAGIDRP